MDTTVRRNLAGGWSVSDLLERAICSIVRDPHGSCWIALSRDQAVRLNEIRKGPFLSVDAAMIAAFAGQWRFDRDCNAHIAFAADPDHD